MTLIEALPKNDDGNIKLEPAGIKDNKYINGYVYREWFENNFGTLANATVPLTDEQFTQLKNIDQFWKMNAEKWRDEGLI